MRPPLASTPPRARYRGLGWCLLAALLLAGCEAPLDLAAVEQARRTPVRRSDVFQAAAALDGRVVVVGAGGVVLNSGDGGRSWRRSELAGQPFLIDVRACGSGWFAALAYEGSVWISDDGGGAWREARLPITDEEPQAVTCDPAGTLWVVGSLSTMWRSTDGGATWENRSRDEDVIFTEIQFVDGGRGYVAGEFGTVLRTDDGGETWKPLPPLPDEFYPQDMYFADRDRGWLAGLAGTILYTEDGGETWQSEETGTLVALYGLQPFAGAMFAVGGEGTILRAGAGRWRRVEHGAAIRFYLRALLPLDGERALVLGPYGTLGVLGRDTLLSEGAGGTPRSLSALTPE